MKIFSHAMVLIIFSIGSLSILRPSEKGDVIGIVVDADQNLNSRWASIRDRLFQIGYVDIVKDPMSTGTIIVAPNQDTRLPKVGVWVMPDNRTQGNLEDFLVLLVPSHSTNRLFKHVKTSISSIPTSEILFPPQANSKATIHTWLAWQKEPGKPLGTGDYESFSRSGLSSRR